MRMLYTPKELREEEEEEEKPLAGQFVVHGILGKLLRLAGLVTDEEG